MTPEDIFEFALPYGNGQIFGKIPRKNLLSYAQTEMLEGLTESGELRELHAALDHPIKSDRLEEMAKPGHKICIVVDDITRPTPSDRILPTVLDRLHLAGIKDQDITILIATGMHRPTTIEEQKIILGPKIVEKYRVINHEFKEKNNMVFMGKSKSGNSIWINRHLIEADIKILVGYVRPHPIFGYSGGRKSIVPGVADEDTNKYNHRPEWVVHHPYCDYLTLENNPSHEDAVDIARRVGVNFIINLVMNKRKEIHKIFAGDLVAAWYKAVQIVEKSSVFTIDRKADIVISAPGNSPDDINLYQALPYAIISRKRPVFNEGATMILAAECRQGLGSEETYRLLSEAKSYEDLIENVKKNGLKTNEHAAYTFSHFSSQYKLQTFVYTTGVAKNSLTQMKLTPFLSLQEAIDSALQKHGSEAQVLIVPDSKYTIVRFKG